MGEVDNLYAVLKAEKLNLSVLNFRNLIETKGMNFFKLWSLFQISLILKNSNLTEQSASIGRFSPYLFDFLRRLFIFHSRYLRLVPSYANPLGLIIYIRFIPTLAKVRSAKVLCI